MNDPAFDATTEAFARKVAEAVERLPARRGLECFAREGTFITHRFYQLLEAMECWEISEAYIATLKANLPGATVRQVDSIAYARTSPDRFDFISIDNPMGLYGPGYAEHFEILDDAARLGRDRLVLATVVNTHPYVRRGEAASFDDYGMTSHERWFERRDAFYGTDARHLELDFVRAFYEQRLATLGYACDAFTMFLYPSDVAGNPDYFLRFVAELRRAG